jgi:hypothetical protein
MNNRQKWEHMQSLVAEQEQRELRLEQLDREIREQERENDLLWAAIVDRWSGEDATCADCSR